MCHVLYAKVRSGWISIKGTLVPVLEQFDEKVSLKVSPLFFEIFFKTKAHDRILSYSQEKKEFQSQTNQQNNSSHLDINCSSNH